MEEECQKYRKEYQERKIKINAIQTRLAASANTAVVLAELKKDNEKLHKEIMKYKTEYQKCLATKQKEESSKQSIIEEYKQKVIVYWQYNNIYRLKS